MTEEEARARVVDDVPRETARRLETYCSMLVAENGRQNLVAASTLEALWSRHILDSAQLLGIAPGEGLWIDIGSGAGLPGMVIAILAESPVMLIEPRARRCAFLREVIAELGLSARVTAIPARAETAPVAPAAIISARAVAALPGLFAMGARFATPDTTWLLMKGQSAAEEVEASHGSWHAQITLVPSVTDSAAAIVVATDVRPRKEKRA
jgi:16S rRNA (guanine527-N7)-methyltransferase